MTTALDRLRELYGEAAHGQLINAFLILAALPALIDLVEALEWQVECSDFWGYGRYFLPVENYDAEVELNTTCDKALLAVKAVKARLEAICAS